MSKQGWQTPKTLWDVFPSVLIQAIIYLKKNKKKLTLALGSQKNITNVKQDYLAPRQEGWKQISTSR